VATFLDPDGQVHHDTHPIPMGNYVIAVGNYVIVTPSQLGNYKIADSKRHVVRLVLNGDSLSSWNPCHKLGRGLCAINRKLMG
jgi:hypothetical protein